MKKIFEMPSIELESLQASEAVMDTYWDADPFALGSYGDIA